MKIIRVFPRKTKATPTDENVRINCGPELWDEADEVHVSVAFTWDLSRAEWLAKQWAHVASIKIGGPATGERSGGFVPGMYLKSGYVITSRGCPNHCWFCSVPKREGNIRQLPITSGWNVLDDNLLACSEDHIRDVFAMLKKQKHRPIFSGGLEAKRLKDWHVQLLRESHPERFYFAYDTDDDWEPLVEAARITTGLCKNHNRNCFVLIGYKGDTINKAEIRLKAVVSLGLTPMAMLWKDESGKQDREWRKFQREWARPAIIYARKVA